MTNKEQKHRMRSPSADVYRIRLASKYRCSSGNFSIQGILIPKPRKEKPKKDTPKQLIPRLGHKVEKRESMGIVPLKTNLPAEDRFMYWYHSSYRARHDFLSHPVEAVCGKHQKSHDVSFNHRNCADFEIFGQNGNWVDGEVAPWASH
jgi:hypothetical protein